LHQAHIVTDAGTITCPVEEAMEETSITSWSDSGLARMSPATVATEIPLSMARTRSDTRDRGTMQHITVYPGHDPECYGAVVIHVFGRAQHRHGNLLGSPATVEKVRPGSVTRRVGRPM